MPVNSSKRPRLEIAPTPIASGGGVMEVCEMAASAAAASGDRRGSEDPCGAATAGW